MAVSFFDDKAITPDDCMVTQALAGAQPWWDELQKHIQENYPSVTGEWKHYGKASGWTLRLLSKKRNLLFFIPQDGAFRLRIVLGEKAAACAEAAELPDEIKEAIRTATPYAEGRSIDIDISSHEQLDTVKRLLKIKFEN